MSALSNADAPLKTAVVRRLRADMDANLISGLTEIPLIIQNRPLQTLDEPYVWINVENSTEVDIARDGSSRNYSVIANVVVRSDDNASAIRTKDDIINELVAILDVATEQYVVIPNYQNGVQNVKSITNLQFIIEGATYFQAEVEIQFKLLFLGEARTATPFQNPIYSYSGFDFTPLSDNIELYDAGDIIGATSYGSSNGWDFDTAVYSLVAGSDGTITDNTIAVATDDLNIDINSIINYTRGTDVTSLTRTTEFDRIRSLRFGVVNTQTPGTQPLFADDDSTDYGLRDLDQWDTGNRHLRFNRVSPVGQILDFDAEVGNYIYIAFDANQPALSSIINTASGIQEETIQLFNSRVIGGYQIYIMRRQVEFADPFNLTLT